MSNRGRMFLLLFYFQLARFQTIIECCIMYNNCIFLKTILRGMLVNIFIIFQIPIGIYSINVDAKS
jgi:hypothetical protein